MSFANVHLQFEPVELQVVDARGQQHVSEYLQQPVNAVTEDVSVTRGPQAQAWVQVVLEEIASFKEIGVYEEVSRDCAAPSIPQLAKLILVTKPNVHGGPAKKKARIVICGNFQEARPLPRPLATYRCKCPFQWHRAWLAR